MMLKNLTSTLLLSTLYLSVASARAVPEVSPALSARQPKGTSPITGACASDSDCTSNCCGFNTGICAAESVSERVGGCGRGNPRPRVPVTKTLTTHVTTHVATTTGPAPTGTGLANAICQKDSDCRTNCCGFSTGLCVPEDNSARAGYCGRGNTHARVPPGVPVKGTTAHDSVQPKIPLDKRDKPEDHKSEKTTTHRPVPNMESHKTKTSHEKPKAPVRTTTRHAPVPTPGRHRNNGLAEHDIALEERNKPKEPENKKPTAQHTPVAPPPHKTTSASENGKAPKSMTTTKHDVAPTTTPAKKTTAIMTTHASEPTETAAKTTTAYSVAATSGPAAPYGTIPPTRELGGN